MSVTPLKREKKEKACLIQVEGKTYVGVPSCISNDGVLFVDSLRDVYEVFLTTNGFVFIRVGDSTIVPDNVFVVELHNNSQYYQGYVKATTGIDVIGGG